MTKHSVAFNGCAIALAIGAVAAMGGLGLAQTQPSAPQLVTFKSGDLQLKGFIWKPDGAGPFPAILWNHGSEKRPAAADTVAPYFVNRGYVFFVPHRRGQGRSPGRYIIDQLKEAKSPDEWSRLLVSLNEAHLQDQLAALKHLTSLSYVDQDRLAIMGASLGGIQTLFAVEGAYGYRVAVVCSGASQVWRRSADLRTRLTDSAGKATVPIFFFQAQNDYDLTPSRVLSEKVKSTGQYAETKTYPAFGSNRQEGHNFCWAGTSTWGPDVAAFIESRLKP